MAQKTQYAWSDNASGNDSYVTLTGQQKNFQPYLWTGKDFSDENVSILASHLIPHAMRAVAGLYQLFWDETHSSSGALQLQVSVTPDPVRPGEILQDTLTVSNRGTTDLTGVVLTDVVPGQVESFYDYLTDGGDCPSNGCEPGEMIAWNLGTVFAGQSVTKQVGMRVLSGYYAPPDGTLIRNSARVFHPGEGFIGLAETTTRVCAAGGTACNHMSFLPLLSVSISGSGAVTSNPVGINCPGDCLESYGTGTVVTLTPNAANGWGFIGWGGNPDCADGQVTVDADKTCTATFVQRFTLTMNKTGTGSGTVTGTGIDCGTDCTESYNSGTGVTLTPTPASGATFGGWSGDSDCTDGQVTMNVDKICTATFNLPPSGPDLTGAWLSSSQLCRTVGRIQKCTVNGKFKEENGCITTEWQKGEKSGKAEAKRAD